MREIDLNQCPSGYEPGELPDCSISQKYYTIIPLVNLSRSRETVRTLNAQSHFSYEKLLPRLGLVKQG